MLQYLSKGLQLRKPTQAVSPLLRKSGAACDKIVTTPARTHAAKSFVDRLLRRVEVSGLPGGERFGAVGAGCETAMSQPRTAKIFDLFVPNDATGGFGGKDDA